MATGGAMHVVAAAVLLNRSFAVGAGLGVVHDPADVLGVAGDPLTPPLLFGQLLPSLRGGASQWCAPPLCGT